MAVLSSQTTYDANPIALARRRLRRMRWIWLAATLMIYFGWEMVNHTLLNQGNLSPAFLLDWLVVFILGTGVLLFISGREDQRLCRQACLCYTEDTKKPPRRAILCLPVHGR